MLIPHLAILNEATKNLWATRHIRFETHSSFNSLNNHLKDGHATTTGR